MHKFYHFILSCFLCVASVHGQVSVSSTAGNPFAVYLTLKDAFNAINTGEHQGAITIVITANVTESASAVLNASGGSSSYTNVIIRPAGNCSIRGNLAAPLIDFNGADNVTVDGRIDGSGSVRNLTISNSFTVSNQPAVSTIRLHNGARNNAIQYCNLEGSAQSGDCGIVLLYADNSTLGSTKNTIDHNDIRPAGNNYPFCAINSVTGSLFPGPVYPKFSDTTVITNNLVHDFFNLSTPAGGYTSTGAAGITLSNSNFCLIADNSFYMETAKTINAPTLFSTGLSFITVDGVGNTVRSNFIGGTAPNANGAYADLSTTGAFTINCIVASGGTSSNFNLVDGNTITNLNISSSAHSRFYGIDGYYGSAEIGTIVPNIIGSQTVPNSIVFSTGGANPSSFTGIILDGQNAEANYIRNNSIGSILLHDTGTGKLSFCGILVNQQNVTEIQNNTIGNSFANNIFFDGLAATMNGISLFGQNGRTYNCSSNIIQNLINNSGGTESADITAISISTNAGSKDSVVFLNNLIQNLASTNASTADGSVKGIYLGANTSASNLFTNGTISGNQIHHLSSVASGSSTVVKGIETGIAYSTALTVQNNAIYTLSSAAPNPVSFSGGAVGGVAVTAPGSGDLEIGRNIIYDLRSTSSSTNTVAGIVGIQGPDSKVAKIRKNKIYNLQNPNAAPSGEIVGILVRGNAGTFDVANNMISLSSANTQVYGIKNNSTAAQLNVYYNSVVLTGTAVNATNSGGFYRSAGVSSNMVLASNIFHNTRTGGGSSNFAILNANGSPTAGWVNPTYINANDLYTSTATTAVLWSNTPMSLFGYQVVCNCEAISKAVPVNFVDVNTADLHLSGPSVMDQNLGGIRVGADDFDGDLRPGRPYTGADEVNLSPLPVSIEYLKGKYAGGKVKLIWEAQCLTPVVLFEVQRSDDGKNFSVLGKIEALPQMCAQPFNFTDDSPLPTGYYRLKLIEASGKTSYSTIIFVAGDRLFRVMTLTPNPVTNKAYLSGYTSSNETMKISVLDPSGRVILHQEENVLHGSFGIYLKQLDLLPNGMFMLSVKVSNGVEQSLKFIKL